VTWHAIIARNAHAIIASAGIIAITIIGSVTTGTTGNGRSAPGALSAAERSAPWPAN